MPLRIVFAGTPDFALPSLRTLAERNEVVAVYTQPDRPAGRGRALRPSPVKLEALRRGIAVLQPETLRTELSRDVLRALRPDLLVVVGAGWVRGLVLVYCRGWGLF
jgi:methionyl-tRNA formyltransferase